MKNLSWQIFFALTGLVLVAQPANAQWGGGGGGGIRVYEATYGQNCGAYRGNATQDVSYSCNNQSDCQYYVSVNRLGDPAPGCTKDFTVQYQCPGDRQMQYSTVYPEANGKYASLSCYERQDNYGISILTATFGANVGAPYGNVTSSVASTCDGRRQCQIYISANVFGDPVPGRDKSFDVQWSCPGSRQPYYRNVPANSNGQTLYIDCGGR